MKEEGAQSLQAFEELQESSSIFKWGKKEKSFSVSAACSSSILNTGKTKKKLKLLGFYP